MNYKIINNKDTKYIKMLCSTNDPKNIKIIYDIIHIDPYKLHKLVLFCINNRYLISLRELINHKLFRPTLNNNEIILHMIKNNLLNNIEDIISHSKFKLYSTDNIIYDFLLLNNMHSYYKSCISRCHIDIKYQYREAARLKKIDFMRSIIQHYDVLHIKNTYMIYNLLNKFLKNDISKKISITLIKIYIYKLL